MILLILLPFFGWIYYDWKSSSDVVRNDDARRDRLVDPQSGGGAEIQYVYHFPEPAYSHSLSTAQIENLSRNGEEALEHYHVYGLTQAGYSTNTLYEINWSKKWFKDEYRFWVENLRVEFTYDTLNVYVTSAYPEGSCEYQATLDHENQHVEVHRRLYLQYQRVLEEAMVQDKDIPLVSHPLVAGSLEEGKRRIGELVSGAVDAPFGQFKAALQAEQGKLDTPENYAALKGECPNW